MVSRRSLLAGAGALALGWMVEGCNRRETAALSVRLLENSVPAQLLREFQRRLDRNLPLNFASRPQLADFFELLQTWHDAERPDATSADDASFRLPFQARQSPARADLVTLGDYWLTPAIQQNLIQPLALQEIPGWQQLPSSWQTLVTRDRQGQPDPNGERWAAPYRWGSAVIAYNVEAFEALDWVPTDWIDLWRPELTRRVSLLNSPRVVIGLTLKRLGQSMNAQNLAALPDLVPSLQGLHQQARLYSSQAYLQPLMLGDTWAAVGWSTDVLPVLERDRRIAAIIPASGTVLTADTWVQPTAPADSPANAELLRRWIEFCWEPDIAPQFSLLGNASSPVILGRDRATLPRPLQTNPLLLPDADILERSEFLLPLSAEAIAQYQDIWQTLRTGTA